MPVQQEGDRLNDLLKWEQDLLYSREKVIIAGGQNLVMGTVIRKTEAGKVVMITMPEEGPLVVHGFLIADYDATDGDIEGVAIVRDAIVIPERLVMPEDVPLDTVLEQFRAIGIVPREEA